MTGAGKYAELSSAVRSFKAQLIQPSQVERAVETGSLSETVTVLTGGDLTSANSSDLLSVESYLTEKVIDLAGRLASYAPHDSRALIRLFTFRYELNCFKEILKSILEEVEAEEAMLHIVPAGKFTIDRCKELIESRNPTRLIDFLQDETVKRSLTGKVASEKGAISAINSVDQYYYAKMWSASNLPDPLDAQSVRSLVGAMTDGINILTAVRARTMGLDTRYTSELFIPVNYALGNTLNELAESTNIQNLMRILEKTPYARAFQGPAGSVAGVELALKRNHAAACLNAFAGSPFKVGIALSFLYLKNYELHDLFAIINGKANNVAAERIFKSLILTNN